MAHRTKLVKSINILSLDETLSGLQPEEIFILIMNNLYPCSPYNEYTQLLYNLRAIVKTEILYCAQMYYANDLVKKYMWTFERKIMLQDIFSITKLFFSNLYLKVI